MIENRLRGKIAQLLSDRELVINIGARDGVAKGMRFSVLAAAQLEIRDPDTNELLGTIDREKTRVEAIDVQDRITVCQTYETTQMSGNPFLEVYASRMVQKRLMIAESQLPGPLPLDDNYVKIGDVVRQVDPP